MPAVLSFPKREKNQISNPQRQGNDPRARDGDLPFHAGEGVVNEDHQEED